LHSRGSPRGGRRVRAACARASHRAGHRCSRPRPGGAGVVTALTVVQGLDVSKWQGDFNWKAWKGKIGFGMAKATEGDGWTDPEFGANWDAMWWMNSAHTFPRWAYHFFHPAQDPVVQAAHLVATVKGHGLL